MTAGRSCPKCGTGLLDDALSGLCPTCLGRFAFVPRNGSDSTGQLSDDEHPHRFGDYELLQEIARGGMGVVYKARQVSLGRTVALKMVLHGPFSSEEFVQRFRLEAQAAAGLHHPNIVPIYEVGHRDGQHYFSMEYIQGQNLAEVVREKPLPARRAAGYLKAMAEAMHYAHLQGVLHRDLKPSNVLLDGLDHPRITDFGLAKLLNSDSQLTVTGQALGSPGHMPPEQAGGKQSLLGPPGDIYSLGAILYHLLTGRPPFQGETLPEILLQVQTAEPVPPRRLNPSIPLDLQTICLKCLEKEPARRYPTAEALAQDLGRFLADEPIQARPVSTRQKVLLWCRRHPGPATLSLALLLAVILGLCGSLLEWRQAKLSATGELKQRQLAEAYAAKVRLNLYAADMNLASQAIQQDDFGLARRTLANLRPGAGETDLRGFEWRLLWNLCQGDQTATLTGHTWIVTCATFSPDSRLLATGSQDGLTKVWDADNATLVTTLPTTGAVWSAAFTPDGELLMTSSHRGVDFWKTGTWQHVTNFPGQLAALSKTGSLLATTKSSPFYWERLDPVCLWNYRTGQKLLELSRPGRALAISADGERLAVAGADSGVYLWDTANGKLLRQLPTQRSVWSLAFSPDGNQLLTTGWSNEPLLWELTSTQPPKKLQGHSLTVWCALFSPDGNSILTAGSDQTIRMWDAVSLSQKAVFHGHESEVWCVACRPDGRGLASGGKDQTVRLWPAELPRRHDSLAHETDIRFLFSPDGTRMVLRDPAGTDPHPRLWDVERRVSLAEMPAGSALGFSPDGRRVVYLDTQEALLQLWSPGETSPSAIKLAGAVVGENGFLRTGMSPGCKQLFAIDSSGAIRFWNATTGELLGTIHGPRPPVRSVVLGPDGRQLALSLERENFVHLLDTSTGRERQLAGHRDFVSGLAFSPDGKTLATGGMDAAIRLWDTGTGTEIAAFSGHMEEVTDLAFSPDGRTLASLGHRDSLKLWHVPTLRELVSLSLPEAGGSFQFSPDGHHLAVATEENTVRLFEAPEGKTEVRNPK